MNNIIFQYHRTRNVKEKTDTGQKRLIRSTVIGIISLFVLLSSCEKFIDPDQILVKKEGEMYADWTEYRSAEMGMYALQQDLVEQLVVLGELRGDLLAVTENATPALKEVYNFNVQRDNPYASPVNFYRLIAACNKLENQLKAAHPEVTDKETDVTTNYDRLYGEVLCMRAWAYFNAVRIYGKVPYIYGSLTDVEKIKDYVNSPSQYVANEYIIYNIDGFHNDTIRDTTIVLNKKFLDQKAIIDTFTTQLETKVKAVGINHSINNGDLTWEVTVWGNYSYHVLLGQMYLFDGNYVKAMEHFHPILYNNTSETSNIRFGLDDKFADNRWKTIFQGIDRYEHIYTLWFGKSFQQTNKLQQLFSIVPPNDYMIKPTRKCIGYWESIFDSPDPDLDNDHPERSYMIEPGIPGDFYRGYGVSYKYYKNGTELAQADIRDMLLNKQNGNNIDVQILMEDVDTVVNKYSIGKDAFAHDANFIVYRAAAIHLYAAEIYTWWEFDHDGRIKSEINTSLQFLNKGTYNLNANQLGVRGRVGFADDYEAVNIDDIIYKHDPATNEITGYLDFTGKPLEDKQKFLIEKILEERARELAFEGERFYDLMRIAKRRNDPSFLANKVASKFTGLQKEMIRQKLMNEDNWYIHYFDTME